MKYWEIIADNLSKAGWSCFSAIASNGRTIWIAETKLLRPRTSGRLQNSLIDRRLLEAQSQRLRRERADNRDVLLLTVMVYLGATDQK